MWLEALLVAVTRREMNKLKPLIKNVPVGREDKLNCALESHSCLVAAEQRPV